MIPFPFSGPAYRRLSTPQRDAPKFVNGVLGGSWETLDAGSADIIVGATARRRLTPALALQDRHLELVFAVAPHHPLPL